MAWDRPRDDLLPAVALFGCTTLHRTASWQCAKHDPFGWPSAIRRTQIRSDECHQFNGPEARRLRLSLDKVYNHRENNTWELGGLHGYYSLNSADGDACRHRRLL